MLSHGCIYRLIREDKAQGDCLYTHLKHRLMHHKRPVSGKQMNIRNKTSIEERSEIINQRQRFGDFEIETIIGKDNKGAVVTLTERTTGFLNIEKLK